MKRGSVRTAVPALFAVVAVGVMWMVFATGDESVLERSSASTRAAEETDGAPMAAALATAPDAPLVDDGTWSLAPDQSLRETVVGASAALVAARMDDVLRPVLAGTRDVLGDFRVALIAADGERRDVRADGAVYTSDLADGGLWIIEAPGVCARWLAAREVAKHLEDTSTTSGTPPLEVALSPAATVVVHVEATPDGRAPIDAIELTAEHADHELVVLPFDVVRGVQPATREQRLAVFAGLRELLDPTLARDRRRDVLAALFAHPDLLRTVNGHRLVEWMALAPWCERRIAAPLERTTTIEDVPSVAAQEVVVACQDVLTLDQHRRSDHERLVMRGRMRTDLLPLAPGATVELSVAYAPSGAVTGVLRDDALLPAKFTLQRRTRTETADGGRDEVALGTDPRVDDDRRFTWPALPPGDYVLNVEWRGPGRDVNLVKHEFVLAAGRTVDLGVLFAPVDGALTIVPRFVNRDGSPFVPLLPPGRVVVSYGSIVVDTKQPWMSMQRIALELENGRPFVVRGLTPADYLVQGGFLLERDADAPLFSPPTGRPRCRIVDSTVHSSRVTVPAESFVEVELAVETLGLVDFELVFDSLVEGGALAVTSSLVGGPAVDQRRNRLAFEARRGDDGATIVDLSATLAAGRWHAEFAVAVARGDGATDWFMTRADFSSTPGDDAVVRCLLEPAAALRILTARLDGLRGEAIVRPDVRRADDFRRALASSSADGHTVYEGLFPRTEYIVLGTHHVMTGEPGSIVDVP